jgi:hypothetical protein
MKKSPDPQITAIPGLLALTGAGLDVLLPLHDARTQLRKLFKAGQLEKITLTALVFRADYPNANFFRFRDEDLPDFAASFAEAPFLRNHDITDIDARAGTVRDSWLSPQGEIIQTIDVTVPRDIEAILNHQIDRFSISWFWNSITCTICNQDWYECSHWPGKSYNVETPERSNVPTVCELIFETPRGRETSAVNTPAVIGTGIESINLMERIHMEPAPVYHTDRNTPVPTSPAESLPAADDIAESVPRPRANEDISSSRDLGAINNPQSEIRELLTAQRAAVLDARLQGASLPAELAELVRQSLPANWRLAELDNAIDRARDAWAKMEEKRTVTGQPARISGMRTGLDHITAAFESLVSGRPAPEGTIPLSGLREFYLHLSGDHRMTGMFQPDNIALANVTTTTMSNIVANVMNKVVAQEFQTYPQWWRPIVRAENFATLQTIRWITLGGVGELPTVNEGAAYTELTWDDKYETASWVKKGGYLGLTLEAMDTDDVGRLRSAPRALAQAAWLTLGSSISAIFTQSSGVGPTLTDTGALFNATAVSSTGGHANLGTSALSSSSWAAAKLAMRKQVEVNSSARLGALTSPRYLLVPPDLENTALTIMASEGLPGTANNDINPEASGSTFDARVAAARRRIIVVDLWTDTNNWAAAADPALYPTIGLGFRFGEAPEIYSVASPTSGLMFTNDVFPVKVRWYYATGPIDFRGLYKANVS